MLALALACLALGKLPRLLCSRLASASRAAQVNGFYVAGALLVPYSWGLHVACWIQKQNGK